MRLWARLTQVIRQVPQVWFDHSRMEVFVMSEELQVSGVVLKISLSDGSDIRSKKISVCWKVSVGEQPPLTLSFSEFSSSCLISFSLASLTACLVTERMASSTQTEHTFSFKTLSAQHHWQVTTHSSWMAEDRQLLVENTYPAPVPEAFNLFHLELVRFQNAAGVI